MNRCRLILLPCLGGRVKWVAASTTSSCARVPGVRKAVRWNSPWYGIEGQGWFVSYRVFTHYVKVTFLNGASLSPVPPGSGKDPDARWVDIYEDAFDEEQIEEWVRQSAAIPGWHGF